MIRWILLAIILAVVGSLIPFSSFDGYNLSIGSLQIGFDPFISPISPLSFNQRVDSVTIYRDEWGIAHVFGEDDESAAFGMAFAQCEDDFLTFQELLLITKGKLASVYGKEKAKIDFLPQFFGIRNISEGKHFDAIYEPMRKMIEAYSDGINYYAALHWDQVIRPEIFPVSKYDLTVGYTLKLPIFVKADRFFNFLNQDDPGYIISTRGRYATDEEKEKRDNQGGDPMIVIPNSNKNYEEDENQNEKRENEKDRNEEINQPSEEDILQAGSNTWAMNGKRTANNQTFLNINSHLPWTGISAWYEIHVESKKGEWKTYGGTLPGSPTLIIGFNEYVGWSHTINRPDLMDVYLISPDPHSPDDFYLLDDKRVPFQKSEMEFFINLFNIPLKAFGFQKDIPIIWRVKQTLLHSIHGPILSRPHGLYAFRISQWEKSSRMFEQWYWLNRARNISDIKNILDQQLCPLFNTVSADSKGNILFTYSASLPTDRSPFYLYHSIIDGSQSDSFWTGETILPFDQLPHVENPESGFVQNCNNSPFFHTTADPKEWPKADNYSHVFPIEKMITNRGQRIYELVSAETNITWEKFIEFKWDMKYASDSYAAFYKQTILEQLPLLRQRRISWTLDPIVPEALELFSSWDLSVDPENRAAALALLTLSSFINYHEMDDTSAIRSLKHDPEPILRSFIRIAQLLKEKFGRLDVEYRQVHRLIRGSISEGMGGGPDVLHCTRSELQITHNDIYNKIVYGDTLTFLLRWSEEGEFHAEGLNQFGAAATRPDSPHYADQVPLMVNRKTRKIHFFLDDIKSHLEREYHPGQ